MFLDVGGEICYSSRGLAIVIHRKLQLLIRKKTETDLLQPPRKRRNFIEKFWSVIVGQ